MGHDLRVVLAYDIGHGIGLGHRRRMEAIDKALRRFGVHAELQEAVPGLAADIAVVDSYVHRADDTSIVEAGYVAAVDDLDRDLDVDLVVDPGRNATSSRRRGRDVLEGLAFAPLDPGLRAVVDTSTGPVRRLLVTTGGADSAGIGARISGEIARGLPNVDVRLVIGPWSKPNVPVGVTAVNAPPNLTSEMVEAQLVVTAGGVSFLEALCLGRGVVVVVTAAGQRGAVREAVEAHAAVEAEVHDVATVVAELAQDDSRRHALGRNAQALVDGYGADRVASRVLSSAGVIPQALRLRRADQGDARLLWEWRNDPTTRSRSFASDPVPWDDHVNWLRAALVDDNRRLYVAENAGRPLGQVRLDRTGDGWEVSITVAPEARGQGHAVAMLRAIECEIDEPIHARIRQGNEASIHAFEQAGYQRIRGGDVLEYLLPMRHR